VTHASYTGNIWVGRVTDCKNRKREKSNKIIRATEKKRKGLVGIDPYGKVRMQLFELRIQDVTRG